MNLHTFEKTAHEKVIEAEARGEAEVSFAHEELHSIKQKIEGRKVKQKRLKSILGGLIALVVLLALGVIYSQYKLMTLAKDETVSPSAQIPKTGEEVVKALSRHILVPSGTPQIAEVQDVARLKESQAFFKDAENGDIVIVYDTMVFVYRPTRDIVVASGDISGLGQAKP